MPEATVLNARQEQSHGTSEKTGRDWTRTDLFDGNGQKYGTFNEKHAAVILATPGKQLDIAWDVKGEHKNLTSVAEHIEPKEAGGSRYDDPATQHKITIQACLKVASQIVNETVRQEFDKRAANGETLNTVGTEARAKAIKMVASELAVWVDEYAARAANQPFLTDDQHDDVPFGEDA